MQDKRLAGKYNRRVQVIKPTTIVNEANEENTGPDEIVYSGYPACRLEKEYSGTEGIDNGVRRSELRVDWDLRFIPILHIKPDWKLKDLTDGIVYRVIAPSIDIGRRNGLLVKTEIIE